MRKSRERDPLFANMLQSPCALRRVKTANPLSARNGLALLSSQNICKTETKSDYCKIEKIVLTLKD